MQVQLTISDAIGQQALRQGLLESKAIENLLMMALKTTKQINQQRWQALVSELAGTWEDFPDVEQLRADLPIQSFRENL